ncbi:hypothetical protein [Hydrogenimonas sp. SS33]|uniref:hypothetical protein n=1 Tax=Hydrogenimonas leucolamina TaxID=2954236 RepID=UPI00336C1422
MAVKKGKEYKEVASKILGCTLASYYNWDKQNRPIIALLEKYFSKEDLEEFLLYGKVRKLEDSTIDPTIIDHAYYSLKPKLKEVFGGPILGPNKIYTKGAKEILIDVLKKISPKDTFFTIENAKDRLLDRISEEELKWLAIKNSAKRDLLSHYIKENFSNAEILAMVQRSDETVEFLKKI